MTRIVTYALWTTAVLNVVGGLTSALAPALNAQLLLAPGMTLDPVGLRFNVIIWLFVLAMGFGYGLAATDPARHTALLLAGGVGKIAAAAVWVEMVWSGLGSWIMAAATVFDGSLGVLFLAYLVQQRLSAAP